MPIQTLHAQRYITPLREGGSLPAVVAADDDGVYVLKFRGAGQGAKALVAELVCAELARLLGLRVPQIVLMELDPELARTEPDPEIQDLIRNSAGLNLALDYLPGSITFDLLTDPPGAQLASQIVWFDAFVTNLDRTPRNTNLLIWHRDIWLIDHGAALYFQHMGLPFAPKARDRFASVKDHVLLPIATALRDADAQAHTLLSRADFERIMALVPDSWLDDHTLDDGLHSGDVSVLSDVRDVSTQAQLMRTAFVDYFVERLAHSQEFVSEALDAQSRAL